MTPPLEDMAEYVLSHPARWEVYLAGYGRGYEDGLVEGHRQAGEEWTAVTTAACRAALPAMGMAEARARRSRWAKPALTAEEIQDHAETSWSDFATKERRPA